MQFRRSCGYWTAPRHGRSADQAVNALPFVRRNSRSAHSSSTSSPAPVMKAQRTATPGCSA
ncbi:MAG TPA: hypothetical protein VKI18_05290, partial [Albitalea sp.]|nr:hypothetical protein [Albitalea sp.]